MARLTATVVADLHAGKYPRGLSLRATPATIRKWQRDHPALDIRWWPRTEKDATPSWKTRAYIRLREDSTAAPTAG